MIKDSLFYGKILLFGEYGIIQDSMGLSIPYNFYKGHLQFTELSDDSEKKSNLCLEDYLVHLEKLDQNNSLPVPLNLTRFRVDLDKGMVFNSSIPQGFGVGSSGALVAAIYDRYSITPISATSTNSEEVLELKKIFGQLESFFHGKSSGLDPLICYLNLPFLIKSNNELESVGIPEQGSGNGAIFLLNTGSPGKTQPMVNIFLEKCKEEGFRNMLKRQFTKYNDACIKAFLNREDQSLFKNVKVLSRILLQHFKPMIPDIFHKLWQEGIDSNAYYLKLCGSGGGGFILGFTKNIDLAKRKLSGYQLDVIHSF